MFGLNTKRRAKKLNKMAKDRAAITNAINPEVVKAIDNLVKGGTNQLLNLIK